MDQNEIFDHSEPAKNELVKIRKFWVALKIWLKTDILTTRDMRRRKFGKIQKFSVPFKILIKIESFDHSESAKDEFDKSRNFESCWKFGLKNIHFWQLGICEEWNLVKFRNFQPQSKFRPKFKGIVSSLSDHPTCDPITSKVELMKFGKFQKFWVMLKILPKIEIFDHSGHAKDMKFGKIQKF